MLNHRESSILFIKTFAYFKRDIKIDLHNPTIYVTGAAKPHGLGGALAPPPHFFVGIGFNFVIRMYNYIQHI